MALITVEKQGPVTVVYTDEQPRRRTDITGISLSGVHINVPEFGEFEFSDFTNNFGTADITELFTYFNENSFFFEVGESSGSTPSIPAMLFGNEYPANAPYPKTTYVTQNGWVGVTLVDNVTSPLEPTFFGDNRQLVDNEDFVVQQSSGTVLQTYDITFTKAGRITALFKIVPEVTANTDYTVIIKNVSTGEVQSVNTITNVANEWETVLAVNTIVTIGVNYQFALLSKNNATTSNVTGGWARINNGNTPIANGDWSITNNGNTLRMFKTDLDGVFRGTELLGFVSGTTINFADTLDPLESITYFTLEAPVDQGTYVEYNVSIREPVGNVPVGTTCTMNAEIPVAALTSYFVDQDYFLSNPPDFCTVISSLSIDDVPQGGQTNNAYGLSLEFEGGEISGDYKITAYTGNIGGSRSGTDTFVDTISFPCNSLDQDYIRNFSSGYEPICSLPLGFLNFYEIEKVFVHARGVNGSNIGGVFHNIRPNTTFDSYYEFSGSVDGDDPNILELTPTGTPIPYGEKLDLRLFSACTGGTQYISAVEFKIRKK